MNRDNIIRMAREVWGQTAVLPFDDIERFAQLVAEKATEAANARANASWTLMCEKMVAAEREACAKVCDELHDTFYDQDNSGRCAEAIRARWQQ